MRKAFLSGLFVFIGMICFSQQIPVGSCGIIYFHDAVGNRTKRVYFCNNGTDPYPTGKGIPQEQNEPAAASTEFQEVSALYPNPTTGIFSITFSKSVNKASVFITDAAGKVITRVRASGYKVTFDLSGQSAGVYYVRIEENGRTITKKVVKQ